jgi:hypothetical protein
MMLYTYICEREYDFNSGYVWGEAGEEKRMVREWIILKYIASVCEDSIIKGILSCWMIGEQSDRERVSNRGD